MTDSELTVGERLMRHLRPRDLLLLDRGFLSYDMFWQIQSRDAYFGTRLRKDVKYQKLQKLGHNEWLVEWTPQDSRGNWKKLPRSIRLRVIHYQIPGFRASAIVTNVLAPGRISREDWVRLASDCEDNGKLTPGVYHRRWEIETTFFEVKVTLQLKSLRSRTPASVEYEIAGRVIHYLLTRWLIVRAAEKHGVDPLRISFTNAVRELEQTRTTLITSSLHWINKVLLPRLLERLASCLVPLRPGRHYPRPQDTKHKDRGHGSKQPAAKLHKRVNSNYRNIQRNHRSQT